MSNEIRVNFTFEFAAAGVTHKITMPQTQYDLTADGASISNIQQVGTSNEALVLGDVAAPKWFAYYNRDDTNYVEIFRDNADSELIARVPPLTGNVISIQGITALYAKANTATVELAYVLVE